MHHPTFRSNVSAGERAMACDWKKQQVEITWEWRKNFRLLSLITLFLLLPRITVTCRCNICWGYATGCLRNITIVRNTIFEVHDILNLLSNTPNRIHCTTLPTTLDEGTAVFRRGKTHPCCLKRLQMKCDLAEHHCIVFFSLN